MNFSIKRNTGERTTSLTAALGMPLLPLAIWHCPDSPLNFFNASNAFISFVADEDTSELFLDSQGSRALIGFAIESGPVDITLFNNCLSSADVLLFDLDNGLQDSIAVDSEEVSLSDGRYAIELQSHLWLRLLEKAKA